MSKTIQYVEIVPAGSKFHVIVGNDHSKPAHKAGNQTAAQATVDRLVKQSGGLIVQTGLGTSNESHMGEMEVGGMHFDINERFEILDHLVGMVGNKKANSMVVVGQGGLGKTHSVITKLKEIGLQDYDELVASAEEGANPSTDGTYKFVSGYSTAKALYRTLYENKNGLVIFDDCDSIQKDSNAQNVLKAALDTYDTRIVSWNAEAAFGDELPRSFRFDGQVIFISNKPLHTWDTAVKSRAMTVDVFMTPAQIVERMKFILQNEEFMAEYDMQHKLDAMMVIEKHHDIIKDLNLRTLIKATQARAGAPEEKWEKIVTYLLTN